MEKRRNKKPKSVGNGEGSLYYSEKLQKWVGQYNEPNGKRKTISQKKGEKVSDFKKRFRNILNDINNNSYIKDTVVSLYNILKDYIDSKHNTGIISDRTYIRNIEILKLLEKCCADFIYRPIQKVNILDIKKALPNFVSMTYDELHTKYYSQNTINKSYMLLKKGFEIAVSDRIISYNILNSESIKKPKAKIEPKKVEALTIDEEKNLISILESTPHKYHDIILLLLYTGLRVGELLAIEKSNVNLKEKTLTIERTLTKNANDKVILGKKTKTHAGMRTVYLNNSAYNLLKKILDNKVTNMYNLIFFDYKNNAFITPTEINSYLQRLSKKYNLCPHIHTHMLRHTYATRCIEAGISAKVLQKNLGHENIETTLNTYTSVFEKFNKDENEKYDIYMKKCMQ